MKNLQILSALSLGLFLLAGCGGGRQEVNVQQMDADIKQRTKVDDMNALLLKKAMSVKVDKDADYVIGADDLMEIEVFQADELRKTVRVTPQGYISLPLIGEIRAKGLTPVQLEKELSKKLEKYLQEPRVSVTLKEYKAQKIVVIGAVGKPDMFTVTGQKYLLDMLIMAGGFSSNAETCYILRPKENEITGTAETEVITISLTQLVDKGDFSLNVPVFNGDVINVPKNGIAFIDGEVNRPGPFTITPKMTLREAIITAGGLKYEADATDVKILRDQEGGRREIIPLNYNDIRDGKSNDVSIREKDIIVVGTNGFKSFVSTFFRFFTGTVNTAGSSVGVTK